MAAVAVPDHAGPEPTFEPVEPVCRAGGAVAGSPSSAAASVAAATAAASVAAAAAAASEPGGAVALVWRMSKRQYLAWTEEHVPGTLRLFSNPLLERLSRTPLWAVWAMWLPLASLMFAHYAGAPGATASSGAAFAVAGVGAWTLLEYLLHRFVFHVLVEALPDRGWANVLGLAVHGIHHKAPMDGDRLVMAPALGFIIAACLWVLLRFTLLAAMTAATFAAVFGGGVLGYVAYDSLHYAAHHGGPVWRRTPVLGWLSTYHLRHHAAHEASAYGVSSPLWDAVFGTLPAAAGGGRHGAPTVPGSGRVKEE
jgi:dihydroceramide fatty acyl 2-hydroxylase